MDSERGEPDTSKEKSQDQPSLLKAYPVDIEQSINKTLNYVGFKSLCRGNGSGSGGRSFARSDMTSHKCGKKGHLKK